MAKIMLFLQQRTGCKNRFSLLHGQLSICRSWPLLHEYYNLKKVTLSENDLKSDYATNLWLAEEVVLGNLLGTARPNHSAILKHLQP